MSGDQTNSQNRQVAGTGSEDRPTENNGTGTNTSENQSNSRRGRRGDGSQRSEYHNYLKNFKGEVPDVGAVLGTAAEQKDMKDRYQNFIDKLVSYVSRSTSYPNARDIEPLLTELADVRSRLTKSLPAIPTETVDGKETPTKDAGKLQYYNLKLKAHVERENHLENNIFQLFKLIWGQLSQALQNRIKREQDFKSFKEKSDVAWLLKTVKCLAANVDHTNNVYKSAIICLRALLAIKQGRNEAVDMYRRRFEGIVDTLSIIGMKNIFRQSEFATAHANGKLDEAEEALTAMCFFLGADPAKYGSLFSTLDTDTLLGNDQYPTDMGKAFDVLCRYHEGRSRNNRRNNDRGGQRDREQQTPHYQFLQRGESPVPGTDGKIVERNGKYPRCFKCNKLGHLADKCPDASATGGTQSVLLRLALHQDTSRGHMINPTWILLDTCSTVTSFMNTKLLKEVRDCKPGEEMKVLANGNGEQDYFQIGVDTHLSIPAYLHEDSIANIVAMADATKRYRVTMDTAITGAAIFVHLDDTKSLRFEQCGQGLYYYDTAADDKAEQNSTAINTSKDSLIEYSLVNTVKGNKSYFSRQEIERADTARLLQQHLDWPSSTSLKAIVSKNLLRNCPISASDVDRADAIYGKAVPICKGKMVRRKPKHYRAIPRVPLPTNLIKEHETVDIYVDFFYVNGKPYLHTKSKPQDFLTLSRTKGRSLSAVKQELNAISDIYKAKGFTVGGYHGDNEFRPLINYFAPTPVHITAANEHNGVIERSICTIEERSRCSSHGVPFPKVPHIMIEHLLKRITTGLNAFPTDTGISQDLSPSAIILQSPSLDYNNISLSYGTYCQVYTNTDNTMRQRSVGAIALRPSNERGGFYFMSLNTGKLIHAFHWESLPIDDHIVGRVVELANNDKAPTMNNGPVFEWRPGIPVTVNEDEDILTDAEDDASDDASLPPLDHGTYPSDSDDDDDAEDDDDDDEFFDLGDVNTPFADDDPPPDPLPENQGAALQNVDTDIDDTSTIGDTSTLDGDDASYTPPTTPENQGAHQANQGAQPSEN